MIRLPSCRFLCRTLVLWAACWPIGICAQEETKPAEAEKPATPPSAAEEAATPAEPPPRRDDFIAKPGAARPKLPGFRETKPLNVPPPKGEIGPMIRDIGVDPAFIDSYAKYQASRLTAKGGESDRDIKNTVDRATTGKGEVSQQFLTAYKPSVVKHLKALLDNSILVQINALQIMSEIQNGRVDTRDAVAVFLEVLKDEKRADAVVFTAVNGLIRAKEHALVRAEEEQEAVAQIIKRLGQSDVQTVLKEKLLDALGVLERAYDRTPEDAHVATIIAQEALSLDNSLRTRGAAARSLARLNLQAVSQWNSVLEAQVLARTMRDVFKEEAGELDNADFNELKRLWALHWAQAISKSLEAGPNASSAEFKQFGQDIAINKVLLPILANQNPDMAALDDWIAKNVPKDLKLAPRGRDIVLESPASVEAADKDA